MKNTKRKFRSACFLLPLLLAGLLVAASRPVEAALPEASILGGVKESRSHTVKKGDTLSKLSRSYGVSVEAIRQKNGLRGDLIRIGDKLLIPASSGGSSTTTAHHRVAKGDNLYRIARQYGVTVEQLKRWNGLSSAVIHPDQRLTVTAPVRNVPKPSAIPPVESPLPAEKEPRPSIEPDPLAPVEVQKEREVKTDLKLLSPIDRLRVQLFLDSELFTPGKVDGAIGEFSLKAASRWVRARGHANESDPMATLVEKARASVGEPYETYVVSTEDGKRVGKVAASIPGKATQDYLPYFHVAEAVSERFHTDVRMLDRLNPDFDIWTIRVGTELKVPAVSEPFDVGADVPKEPSGPSTNRVVIVWPEEILEVRNSKDELVASFPVTLGNSTNHVRNGTWKLGSFSPFPTFRWDRSVLNNGVRSSQSHLLPPGPNNLVGVLWMGLKKPDGSMSHVGIHGTDHPETIGRAQSSGCIRLANWDVVRLARLVNWNTPVSWSRS